MSAESESTDTSASEGFLINVRCLNGKKINVLTSLEYTVAQFKELVALSGDVPAAQQRLIYKGRILKDNQTLQSYGLQAEHTVHMFRSAAPTGSTSTTPVNAPTGGNTNSASTVPSATLGAGFGASLFSSADFGFLGDSGGNLGAGMHGLEQMQQQMAQNPDMTRKIMNMPPAVQSLMNDPELMRTMFMNNPQTRELIDRNPELAHILNDPSIIRQALERARNPELMREMMRNTDREMSNIESSPEGFNMLRRMYENVQEPFLNAMVGGAGNDTVSNPFANLLGNHSGVQVGSDTSSNGSETAGELPNSNPLPNPWGAPQTNTASRNAPLPEGLGLPNMDPLSGGISDAAMMKQLLQNPATGQIMRNVFSNHQDMNQFLNANPQMRSVLDSNPLFREKLLNPEFLRQLTKQDMMTLLQMITLREVLLPMLDEQYGARGRAAGLQMLMKMFSEPGLDDDDLNVPNTSAVPPEELYATQQIQLQEMGFFDAQANVRALQATSGNIHAAVKWLLNNLGQ